MKKYTIEITETLQKQIEVEAETNMDAIEIARKMYRNSEIVLSAEDYIDTEIRAIPIARKRDDFER